MTRSLADFAKLVELFDAPGVSFVSVTQQFNTTNGPTDPQRARPLPSSNASARQQRSKFEGLIGQTGPYRPLCN